MDKAECVAAFNQTMQEFTRQLVKLFPNSTFLVTNTNKLNMLSRVQPKRPSWLFFEEMHPLTVSIINKDVDTFRNMMNKNKARSAKTNVFALLEYMNSIWDSPKMTDESKDNVWKYMILMTALANKIHVS